MIPYCVFVLPSAMLLQGYMYGETGTIWQLTITPHLHAIIYKMDYPFRGDLFMGVIFLMTELFPFLGICHNSIWKPVWQYVEGKT